MGAGLLGAWARGGGSVGDRLAQDVAEAFGFRKVLDATFMIGFLVTGLAREATPPPRHPD